MRGIRALNHESKSINLIKRHIIKTVKSFSSTLYQHFDQYRDKKLYSLHQRSNLKKVKNVCSHFSESLIIRLVYEFLHICIYVAIQERLALLRPPIKKKINLNPKNKDNCAGSEVYEAKALRGRGEFNSKTSFTQHESLLDL